MANAVNPHDDDWLGDKNLKTVAAVGEQGNVCDASDGTCTQANVDQSASGSDNKAVGFNDQSGGGTGASGGDNKAAAENFTNVLLKIDGIDHSTVKVKVWVAANGGKEISKTFNPVPLLNPEDDDRGLFFVPMKVEKGVLDIGDTFTGCIKVIEDTDKYGNKQSCQQSVLRLGGGQETPDSVNPAAASAPAGGAIAEDGSAGGDRGGGGNVSVSGDNGLGVAVMRISL